jgi:enediyne biosynthesis protein E4
MLWHLSSLAQGVFEEVSQQAGISHYQESLMHLGGGVAVFDLDNDGWDDIYLTGGLNRDKLYRNNTDGTFTDIGVAAGIGITASMTTHGVVTGDIDNDGHRDILVLTELGEENLLFRNNGNGTFTRVVGVFNVVTTQRALSATLR